MLSQITWLLEMEINYSFIPGVTGSQRRVLRKGIV